MRDNGSEGIDLRSELLAARPKPSDELVSTIVESVQAEHSRLRVASRRPALALAMTFVALGVAAGFGGISEAAVTVGDAVGKIVHIGTKAKPHHAGTTGPAVSRSTSVGAASNRASGATSSAAEGSIRSHSPGAGNLNHVLPPSRPGPPSGSPAQDQYNPGCSPGFRGPYVACEAP
jgi:hypothetical protein